MLFEKTQRRLCRLLFCLGCVLPTVAIGGWSAARLHPAYQERLLDLASQRLGLRVACLRFDTPRPGDYELHGVSLGDTKDGQPLATLDRVRLRRDEEGWRFAASAASIEGDRLAELLGTMLDHELVAHGTLASCTLQGENPVSIGPAIFESGPYAEDSEDEDHESAGLRARLAADETFSTEISQPSGGETRHWVIDSPGIATPLAWIDCPVLEGADLASATLRGRCEAILTDGDDYRGVANGVIELPSHRGDEAAWRTGSLLLRQFAWKGTAVERLDGRLELLDGHASRRLVLGLNHTLGCDSFDALRGQFASSEAAIAFSQLACDVELTHEGLTLLAGCGEIRGKKRSGQISHAILEREGEALLREPDERSFAPSRLIQALWYGARADLPDDRRAQRLALRMPIKSAVKKAD